MELFGKYGWFEIDINKVNVAKCLEMVHTHFKSDSSCSKDIDFESFKSYIEQYRDVDEPKSKRQSAGMEINAILCSKAKKKIEFWQDVIDRHNIIWTRLGELRATCTDKGVNCEIPVSIKHIHDQQLTIAIENLKLWEPHEQNYRKIFVQTFGTEPLIYGNQNKDVSDKRPISDKEFKESETYGLNIAKDIAVKQENQPQTKVVTADEQKELSHQDKKEIKSKTG